MTKSIVFRQASNLLELKSLLKLRYHGYLNSQCASLIEHNKHQIDLDGYDLRSLHFGLFQTDGLRAQPIGYVRLIQDEMSPVAPLLWQLAFMYPELRPKLEEKAPTLFPFMQYHPDQEQAAYQIAQAKAEGKKMVEASRFVFDPSIRSRGLLGFVTEATLSIVFFGLSYHHLMLVCNPSHCRFYTRVGFQFFDEGLQSDYQDLPARFMVNQASQLPEQYKKRMITLACQYDQYGGIRRPDNSGLIKSASAQKVNKAA